VADSLSVFANAAQVAIYRDKRAPHRPALFALLPGIAVNFVPAGLGLT
jgi:hypothetical protein